MEKTLDRAISKAGYGSRSEARRWIEAGRVAVDGIVQRDPDAWVELGRQRISFDGEPLRRAGPVYLLLHKPKGYLTTSDDPEGRPTVYDLLPPELPWVSPVGRLDLDSSGLLVLTNDTLFAEHLASPDHQVAKTYQVKASRFLSDEDLGRLRRGIELADGRTRPAEVTRLRNPGGRTVFEIVLREGRNRQVRRMVEALGAKVLSLTRTAIGEISLGDLPAGHSRPLTAREIRALGGRPRRAAAPPAAAAPAAAPSAPSPASLSRRRPAPAGGRRAR